jgi:hypothetical protein
MVASGSPISEERPRDITISGAATQRRVHIFLLLIYTLREIGLKIELGFIALANNP